MSMIINNRFLEEEKEQTAVVRVSVVKPELPGGLRTEELAREHVITVSVNENALFRLTCTPNMLSELVLGRLVTEGLIREAQEVESLYICENGSLARVYLRKEIGITETDAPQTEPTCCTDNRLLGGFTPIYAPEEMERAAYTEEDIFALIGKFSENTFLHMQTEGTHSCYLSYRGEYQGVFEDIGRHNALDKAAGYALLNGLSSKDCILFTTGRVPVDMVKKAVAARFPVLATKSVPTAEAVELARRFGLTLICRAWPDSYEIYH